MWKGLRFLYSATFGLIWMKFSMANFISNSSTSQKTPPAREWFFIACLLKGWAPHFLSSGAGIGFFSNSGSCLGRKSRTQASVKGLGLVSNQYEQCKTHMSTDRQISELGTLRPKTVYEEGRIMQPCHSTGFLSSSVCPGTKQCT